MIMVGLRSIPKTPIKNTYWFFGLFLVCVIIISSPSKVLYYTAPIIIVLFSITKYSIVRIGKLVLLIIGVVLLAILNAVLEMVNGNIFNFPGIFFALLLYLPVFIFIARKKNFLFNDRINHKMISFVGWFVIIQSIIGIVQSLFGDNWDGVSGTFGFFDLFAGTITISQVMYTFNLFVMFLFLIPHFKKRIAKSAIAIGFVAVSIAQSGHQTIFFLITLIAIYASFKNLKILGMIIILITALVVLVEYFFPQTTFLITSWFNHIIFGNFPKTLVVRDSIELLSEPKTLFLGTGIGQFSSRAALFSSGEYLNFSLPGILMGKSSYFLNQMTPLLELQDRIGQGSAIAKPYFSVVSVLVEMGVVVSLILGFYLYKEYRKNKSVIKQNLGVNNEIVLLSKFLNGTIIFFLLCCFIENYAEFVQAITLPIMLYIYASGRINYLNLLVNNEK